MWETILEILINAVAVFVAANIITGVQLKGFKSAIIVAIVLALLNWCIRPILEFFSAPVTWLTFGLFVWIIDAAIILIADKLLDNFKVNGCITAILFGLVMGFINWVIFQLV